MKDAYTNMCDCSEIQEGELIMSKPDINIIIHFIDGKELKITWCIPEFESMDTGKDAPKPRDGYVEIQDFETTYVFNWNEIRYIEVFEAES